MPNGDSPGSGVSGKLGGETFLAAKLSLEGRFMLSFRMMKTKYRYRYSVHKKYGTVRYLGTNKYYGPFQESITLNSLFGRGRIMLLAFFLTSLLKKRDKLTLYGVFNAEALEKVIPEK